MKKLLRLRVSVGVECQDVRREPTRANRSGQLKQQSTEVDCDITANKGTYGECELPGAVFFFYFSPQLPSPSYSCGVRYLQFDSCFKKQCQQMLVVSTNEKKKTTHFDIHIQQFFWFFLNGKACSLDSLPVI